MIGILVLLTTTILSLCFGSNFAGPRNITRGEGSNFETIPCQLSALEATPFWKINSTIYYYSDVPPPFKVSKSNREITITTVDLSLNGTSFQCFIPSGNGLITSSIGILTVTDKGLGLLQESNDSQPKLAIVHQNLSFSPDTINLTWGTYYLNQLQGCDRYRLIVSHECGANSNNEFQILIDGMKDSIVIHRVDLIGEYFNISSYDEEGNLCEEIRLEVFAFDSEIVTEDLLFEQRPHFPTLTCTEIPPLTGRKTLVLAIPYLPATGGFEEDLLCPVHPLLGERCVDLLSCNRFRESAYANSITVCRTVNNDSNLEMCFHNTTQKMNGVRLHFFYSNLHCNSRGDYESTRLYVKSVQLHIINEDVYVPTVEDSLSVSTNHSRICISSNCNLLEDCDIMLQISTVDKFSCTTYIGQNVTNSSYCIFFSTLQMNPICAPYYIEVEAYNRTIYNGSIIVEIQDYADSSVMIPSSKCPCYSGQSAGSISQGIAIAVCAIIVALILTLFLFIAVITYRNYRLVSH